MASLPGPSTVPSFNQNLKANGFATGMNKILPVLPVLPVLPQRKFEFKMGTSSDSRGSASQINFSFKGGGNVASGSHQNGIDREISKENGFGPPTQIQSRSVLPAKSLFSQNGNTAQSNRFSFKLNPPGNLPRVNFGFPSSSSHQSSNQIKAREHPKSNGYFSVSYDDPAMKKPRLQ
ncbi:unnamed protein product [Cylicostephanus goldi]|uniref:Uncharacterized protein n=1 Tax=Cylicostephanus goldi TaxID=71465 RepID=A0A3P6RV21_CYLGO|nr:unnamed protein product [Cylicostephanus goldi]